VSQYLHIHVCITQLLSDLFYRFELILITIHCKSPWLASVLMWADTALKEQ
jgi:hypothetical protein